MRPAALAALLLAAPAGPAAAAGPLRTEGGEVTAARPPGADWTCRAFARAGDGFRLAELKCWRGEGPDLLLYAKDYEVAGETVETVCGKDWPEYFKELLPTDRRAGARRTTVQGLPGCAVEADGKTAQGQATRVREWYAVAPGHVLIVSAAGRTPAVQGAQQAIDAWREGVRFAAAAGRAPGATGR